jgi:hypothetical protein
VPPYISRYLVVGSQAFGLVPILGVGSHLCFKNFQYINHSATLDSQHILTAWNSSEGDGFVTPTTTALTLSPFGVGSCHFHQFLEGSFCNGVGGFLFRVLHLLFIATGAFDGVFGKCVGESKAQRACSPFVCVACLDKFLVEERTGTLYRVSHTISLLRGR